VNLRNALFAAVAAAGLCLASTPALADSAPGKADNTNCFLSNDWQGWKSPAPSVLYLRVGISRVYRLDLKAPADSLQDPGVHLVNKVRGSDWLCNPLDFDLSVNDDHGGMREPLFVKSVTQLTPEQIAAIPPKFRP
jgi:hypothetical protein